MMEMISSKRNPQSEFLNTTEPRPAIAKSVIVGSMGWNKAVREEAMRLLKSGEYIHPQKAESKPEALIMRPNRIESKAKQVQWKS